MLENIDVISPQLARMRFRTTFLGFLLISTTCFSQTDWQRGYESGYKEGYCYGKFGCISPYPPPSMPALLENSNSYQDGYNNGFRRGSDDSKKSGSRGQTSNGFRSQTPNRELQRLYMQQQAQAELATWEDEQRQKKLAYMEVVNKFYGSFSSYPEQVIDGWHKVVVTNNYDVVQESKAYVSQNRILHCVEDNWKEIPIISTSQINKARALLSLNKGGKTLDYEVIFMNYLSTGKADTPPLGTGTVTFYLVSKKKFRYGVSVDVEDKYVGSIITYFADGHSRPSCNDSGCLTFRFKEGTYDYTANAYKSNRTLKATWSGTVTILKGNCSVYGLRTD